MPVHLCPQLECACIQPSFTAILECRHRGFTALLTSYRRRRINPFHVATDVAGKGTTMDPQPLTSPPRERAIVTYWRLPRANGQTLACTSYRTPNGLDLRACFDGDAPVLQTDVMTHAEAQQLAERWRLEIARSAAA